jgi:hypothetical protein
MVFARFGSIPVFDRKGQSCRFSRAIIGSTTILLSALEAGNMKVTVDEEDVGEEAFNEILRLARTGETSELYKDSKKTWVLYGVSMCHPSHVGYARSENQQGIIIENLHGLLANTEGTPFTDKMDTGERDELESILAEFKENEVMKLSGERWYLDSSEPIKEW